MKASQELASLLEWSEMPSVATKLQDLYCKIQDLELIAESAEELINGYSPAFTHKENGEDIEWQECFFCNATGWNFKHFNGCPWVNLKEALKALDE